jgi:hypothetical protein
VKPFIHEVTAIVAASPGFRPIIRRLALAEDADLIVSEWVRDPSVTQRLLRLAQELKLPAVFIRPGKPVPDEQALDILEPDKKTSSDHGVLSGNVVTQ